MAGKASRRQVAKALVDVLENRPQQRQAILRSVAAYMVLHKQTRQLDLLLKDIARELHIQTGQLYTEVLTAFALEPASRTQLEQFMAKQTGATRVELAEQVRPELLSGVVLQTPEQELDLSARRKLNQLASLKGA